MRQRVTVLALCVCVCLSVCLLVSYYSRGGSFHSNARYKQGILLIFDLWIVVKMLRSEVMVSFAYRESHQRYHRNPELIPLTTQGYKVVQKPNGALNATWNTS